MDRVSHPRLRLGAATLPEEDKLPEELTSDEGQQQYLSNRALYEDEWADWLVDMGKAEDKAAALEMVRANPMFSEGGRVKAQGGLFAGQMPGRNPGMNPMAMNQGNPMGMNQGLGAPNLGSRSMGMTPGMGQQPIDPRMAQMMQAQKLQGGLRKPIPKESEDTELIQLIKMLTSLGIPMEQLRGRTKEELVEMLVSVKGKMGGEQQGRPEVEEEVEEEEEVVEEVDESLKGTSWFKIIIWLIIGGAALYGGSELLVNGSVALARDLGVSERVISVTMIAIGTSVPELAASVIAALKKEKALSFGNLIGSNIFNIASVLGITSLIQPIVMQSQQVLSNDIYWMIAFSFILVPLAFLPKKFLFGRIKGLVILAGYSVFIYITIFK